MAKLIALGHAQHLICSDSCKFRIGTEVIGDRGHYLVSTVGGHAAPGQVGFSEIGYGRLYETFVFRLASGRNTCGCPIVESWGEIDSMAANTAAVAQSNHTEMVERWSKIADHGEVGEEGAA